MKQRYLSIAKCPKRRKSTTRRREIDCKKTPSSRSCRKSRRKPKKSSRRKNRGRDSFKKTQCQAPGARYYVKGANQGPEEKDHKNNSKSLFKRFYFFDTKEERFLGILWKTKPGREFYSSFLFKFEMKRPNRGKSRLTGAALDDFQ